MPDRLDLIQKQQGSSKGDEMSPDAAFALSKIVKSTAVQRVNLNSIDLEQTLSACEQTSMELRHPDHTDVVNMQVRPAPPHPGSTPRSSVTQSRLASRLFLGLVVIARAKHPIPSRSRQLSAVAPMVLHLKVWESRSPPNLVRYANLSKRSQ